MKNIFWKDYSIDFKILNVSQNKIIDNLEPKI